MEDAAALQVAEAVAPVAAVAAVVAAAVAAAMAAVVAAVAAAGAVGAAGAADPAVAATAAVAVVVPSMVQVKEGCLAASTGWWNQGVRVFPLQASGSRSARVNLIEMIEMVSLPQFCSSVLEAGFYSLAPWPKIAPAQWRLLRFQQNTNSSLEKRHGS